LALRCRIVLACADGDRTRDEIAAEVGCNPATVTKWRHRFAADRLDGLVDAPRPGAARSIGDDVVEAIVVETLETAPPDATLGSANVNIEVAYLATNTRLVFAVDDLDTARSAL
jgi:transposase-like protein